MPKLGMEPIRRSQIRRAAAGVIARRGFDATTIKDVASAARVSTGMINHYYPNKVAMMVDAFVSVSEWFQDKSRAEIARENTGLGKLRALIRAAMVDSSKEFHRGHRVWVLAVAESIKSKPLAAAIHERRKLYRQIILDVVRGLDAYPAMRANDAEELASEYDAYLTGFSMHYVTGEMDLTPDSVERSMLAMAEARTHRASAFATGHSC